VLPVPQLIAAGSPYLITEITYSIVELMKDPLEELLYLSEPDQQP
jgi:hypothetical protein